jgi:alpha-acetolactate decarboxylase
MSNKALFAGLVIDENGQPLEVSSIGDEAQYVLNDNGFRRHIDAEVIDRQVLTQLQEQIEANKEAVEQGIMKMMGSEDIFTKAAIDKSIKDMDQVMKQGLPDDARQMLGMMGFRVVVNYHGEVLKIDQPGVADDSDE